LADFSLVKMVKPKISLIAVIAENNALGKDNKLLWHLPEDLQKFKRLTFNHPIIMGRKTFESIGRSLPGRLNIVISRDKNYKVKSGLVFNDLGKAILFAQKKDKQEVFIIGGGQIYQQSIKLADKLYLTLVKGKPQADTFFPDYSDFKKVVFKQKGKKGDYWFLELER